MNVTYYSNFGDTKNPQIISIDEALTHFITPNPLIDSIRLEPDKAKRTEMKRLLPCVQFSGEFSERKTSGLIGMSNGLVQVEFDGCSDNETTKNLKGLLIELPYVYLCGVSVSGLGVFALIKVNGVVNATTYKAGFRMIESLLTINPYVRFGEFDSGVSDIARLRYVSYDDHLYINHDSTSLDLPKLEPEQQPEPQAPKKSRGRPKKVAVVPAAATPQYTRQTNRSKHNPLYKDVDSDFLDTWLLFMNDMCWIDKLDNYFYWRNFGMAMKNEMLPFEDFDEISSFSKGYKGTDDTLAFWNSLTFMATGGFTKGTLLRFFSIFECSKDERLPKTQLMINTLFTDFDFIINEVFDELEYRDKKTIDGQYVQLTDNVLNQLVLRAHYSSKKDFSPKAVYVAITGNCQELGLTYNPIKDAFDKLQTIDDENIFVSLCNAIGVDASVCVTYFKKWFTGAVRNIYATNKNSLSCSGNDLMLILKGKQGVGKNRLFKHLASIVGNDYCCTYTDSITDKDFQTLQHNKFLIFLDELSSLHTRVGIESVKAMISKTEVCYRKPYGTVQKRYKVLASYIGSTNESEFLNDHTGNRRFLVIEMAKLDTTLLPDVDQIWGYAKHLYLSGYQSWLSQEEVARVNERNQSYATVVDWLELFDDVVDSKGTTLTITASILSSYIKQQFGYKGNITRNSIVKEFTRLNLPKGNDRSSGVHLNGYQVPINNRHLHNLKTHIAIVYNSQNPTIDTDTNDTGINNHLVDLLNDKGTARLPDHLMI